MKKIIIFSLIFLLLIIVVSASLSLSDKVLIKETPDYTLSVADEIIGKEVIEWFIYEPKDKKFNTPADRLEVEKYKMFIIIKLQINSSTNQQINFS